MNGMNRMFVRDQRESEPAERMFLVQPRLTRIARMNESPFVSNSPHHSSNSCYSWLTKEPSPTPTHNSYVPAGGHAEAAQRNVCRIHSTILLIPFIPSSFPAEEKTG